MTKFRSSGLKPVMQLNLTNAWFKHAYATKPFFPDESKPRVKVGRKFLIRK